MRLTKFFTLILCSCLLLGAVACVPTPGPDTQPEQTTGADSAPETDVPVEPDPPKDAIEAKKEALSQMKQNIGATTDTVLYVKDFGAVGDGITDDGAAIFNAVCAAAEQHATLKFEQDKKYCVNSVPGGRSTPFALQSAEGLTIDGCNSTLIVAPDMGYIHMVGCGNVKVTNLHFDYTASVYLVGTVKSVDGKTVVYSTDIEPFAENCNFAAMNGFSIMYNEGTQQRPHMFMTSAVKTGEKELTVTYASTHHYKEGDVVFLPNPGVGHAYSEVVTVGGSTQPMLFENIGIHAASTFICAIKENRADVFFENVDLVPSQDNQRQIKMVSWRDGYHCKDNTAALHWNNCEADVLFDDVFNIAGTLGVVTAVESNMTFTVENYELAVAGYKCSPGDTVDVYNLTDGSYKGCARVRSVIHNADGTSTLTLFYGQPIEDITSGCVVANRNTGAPGSTITNCHFQGTFRFLRNLYVENTVFDQLITWMMVEGSVEGPMPGNVDFVGCTFNGGDIQIDAYNRNTAKRLKKIGREIVDIGFWGCTFNGSKITTKTDATYTVSDAYTTDDLFTVKNAATAVGPMEIKPTEQDLEVGVIYDWTMFTMPMTGDIAAITPLANLDAALASKLNVENVSDNVLQINAAADKTLYFDGWSASALPSIHKDGNTCIIKLTYYTEAPVKASLVIGDQTVADNLFEKVGELTTVTFTFTANGKGKTAYIACAQAGTVYLGEVSIATFANTNPSNSQLENGHTFIWNDQVKIKGSTVVAVESIENAAAKQAILNAPDQFGETVLHLNGAPHEFTGFTKKSYYVPGTTYRISIDAYIASPASAGTTMYLLALDSTQGNRVLKEGIFSGEGMYHFEMNWQIGNTDEYQLTFFVNSSPAQYADIYVGNFTITKLPGMTPNKTIIPDSMATPTKDQLKEGFTYDFGEGVLFETTKNTYVDASCLNQYTAKTLEAAGFGEYAYYFNENFDGVALANPLEGGKKHTITLRVYDCKGNLDDNARGAFVLLNMTGGGQNSAECNYTIKADSECPGVYYLTFVDTPPSGTDTLRFYQIEPCEFYIDSITVKIG